MNDSTSNTDLSAFAERFEFSEEAVRHLRRAVRDGGGDMAMFDHPEFAGPGQWMRGGLIMITEPANQVLKNRIDALCNALSERLRSGEAARSTNYRRIDPNARAWDTTRLERERWWPAELGEPSALGEQETFAYAYFDDIRRLAVRDRTQIAVYDTGAHRITGVAQSLSPSARRTTFTSQLGEVAPDDLARCDDGDPRQTATAAESEPATDASSTDSAEILNAIARLGELRREGILTEDEFVSKKQALLSRL